MNLRTARYESPESSPDCRGDEQQKWTDLASHEPTRGLWRPIHTSRASMTIASILWFTPKNLLAGSFLLAATLAQAGMVLFTFLALVFSYLYPSFNLSSRAARSHLSLASSPLPPAGAIFHCDGYHPYRFRILTLVGEHSSVLHTVQPRSPCICHFVCLSPSGETRSSFRTTVFGGHHTSLSLTDFLCLHKMDTNWHCLGGGRRDIESSRGLTESPNKIQVCMQSQLFWFDDC